MLRSLAAIVAAIQLSRPTITEEQATTYAVALQRYAEQQDFDPLTGVAIIHHESRFNPVVVSKNGEDFGLAQIRARFIGACKDSPDPLRNPTPACKQVKATLLDPEHNIRMMGELISKHRNFCKKKVGSERFERWLASYQGRNYPKRKQWCKPGGGTWQVINYRRKLIRELMKRGLLETEAPNDATSFWSHPPAGPRWTRGNG